MSAMEEVNVDRTRRIIMKVCNYTDDAAISKLIIHRANTRRSSRVQSPG